MDEELARKVKITLNSVFHVGNSPVTSKREAIQLTQERRNIGWNGQLNHVIYDFNKRNLEETLFNKLCAEGYEIQGNDFIVQLPSLDCYIVDENNIAIIKEVQCYMKIDRTNMNAYHIEFC
ncbi:MAG: hypothetical protein GY760_18760 [Deltaproteobacteria bacterium]|nr:hypothetical protein [Deltaproteobacteria bacterium]